MLAVKMEIAHPIVPHKEILVVMVQQLLLALVAVVELEVLELMVLMDQVELELQTLFQEAV
jgi:hypothetical protein